MEQQTQKQLEQPLLENNDTENDEEKDKEAKPAGQAYLVYFPAGVGHLSVLVKDSKGQDTNYWSWGGNINGIAASLEMDKLQYGQPIQISLCPAYAGSIRAIDQLFEEKSSSPKLQKTLRALGLAVISAGTATAIYYNYDLKSIPKVSELPTIATAALIALAAFATVCLLAYRLGFFDVKKTENTFNNYTYAFTGISGKNCVQAAKIITGELVNSLEESKKNRLRTLANSYTLTPEGLAKDLYNQSDEASQWEVIEKLYNNLPAKRSLAYYKDIENLANHIKAYELLGDNHKHRPDIKRIKKDHLAISLAMAIDRMETHAASVQLSGWCPKEIEKVLNCIKDLKKYHNLKQFKKDIKAIHLDLYRRLGNIPAILFYSTAVVTPIILFNTGKLDKLSNFGSDKFTNIDSKIAVYAAIFLVSALLASYAIARLSKVQLPFLYRSESLTKICDDVYRALEKVYPPMKTTIATEFTDTDESKAAGKPVTDSPIKRSNHSYNSEPITGLPTDLSFISS